MISITFTAQRRIIRFTIDKRVVIYSDDNWKDGIQIMPSQTPKMKLMLRKMLISRKQALVGMGTLIVDANSGENKKEYDLCKDDGDIADMIRKDCINKGLVEAK